MQLERIMEAQELHIIIQHIIVVHVQMDIIQIQEIVPEQQHVQYVQQEAIVIVKFSFGGYK